ncbi:MAG: histidine kinase, partial [Bacteroidota bacterium]
FIFKNDVEKANYYLARFSRLMRDSLQFSRIKYISLAQELTFLNNYLHLEQMRFPQKFDYQLLIDEEMPTEAYLIPALLLQPILENIIKHAFKDLTYKGNIYLEIIEKVTEKELHILIRDNGPGLGPMDQLEASASIEDASYGLKIIRERIQLLNHGQQKAATTFEMKNLSLQQDGQTGLQVEFTIPLKTRDDIKSRNH